MPTTSRQPPEGSIEHKLDQIASAMERMMRAAPRLMRGWEPQHCDLTPHQFMLLRVLEAGGPMSIGALRLKLHGAQSTTSEMVARLAKGRYVRKRPDPHDKRAVVVALTPRGRDAIAVRLREIRERHQVLLEALAKDDQNRLLDVMETLAGLVERAADSTPETVEGGGDDNA